MNQKLETLLQMALVTPEEERARTAELNVGFDESSRTWELIVKYHESLDALTALDIEVEYLIAGYALLTVPEELVEYVAGIEQIEYVEKPKRYFFGQVQPTENSCVAQVTLRDPNLSGEGVLVAVLDSGIDYSLPEFRNADGSTRILYLWDQTLIGQPPEGYALGVEFTAAQINQALMAGTSEERFRLMPSIDVSGHGTAVAGIAVGRSENYRGIAPESSLLVVKLGQPRTDSFPRTTEIMRAVTYAVNKAIELQMPLVINLSFGNTYGAHDGSSLLERFLDNAAEIGWTVICVGSGNEGSNGGHVAGSLRQGAQNAGGRNNRGAVSDIGRRGIAQAATVELAIADYESSLSIQLWKNYSDVYRIVLRSPSGQEVSLPESINSGKYTLELEQTQILVYFGVPAPYSVAQEIYFEFLPLSLGQNYINSGVWAFRLEPLDVEKLGSGNYYFYLPSAVVRSSSTGFYRPTPDVTLTIPATAAKVISVGAYDPVYEAYADFSGRGYADAVRTIGIVTAGLSKPDLVAPGVGIQAPDIYGGYNSFTGTSFATPIVSGSAALLMEWGIVRGNDLFLYGEKVKAYLRKGAQPLRGETVYPNEKVGWGALCVAESIPV